MEVGPFRVSEGLLLSLPEPAVVSAIYCTHMELFYGIMAVIY